MNRNARANVATETVAIAHSGSYRLPDGRDVSIREEMEASVRETRVITPRDWNGIVRKGRVPERRSTAPQVEVTGETTLEAARRLSGNGRRVFALNFASARNPGGGFLGGSQAQEESLARASGLYATLLAGQTYYEANRRESSKLYTDHAILSPDVPVFRDEEGALLERPFLVTFLTMPAPNRGAIGERTEDFERVGDVLRDRITDVCAIAATTGQDVVILGAWGCGVFRNDPTQVAELFAEVMFGPDRWANCFEHVCFAVFDRTDEALTRKAFEQAIGARKAGV